MQFKGFYVEICLAWFISKMLSVPHVVHCMKLSSHQIALLHDFFDAYLSLLEYGEEQAEAFYKTVMRL